MKQRLNRDWNPQTHAYCVGCPFYEPVANFIYEMERDPKERKCKFLKSCNHVAKHLASRPAQLSLFEAKKL